MSLETPKLDQEPKQGGGPGFRFVVNVLLERWKLIASLTILGAVGLGAGSILGRPGTPPTRYGTHVDVILALTMWDEEALRGASNISLFSKSPLEMVERTSSAALAREVTAALVQRDTLKGGAYGGLTEAEIPAKAAELEGRITIQPLEESNKVRISVANCASRQEAEDIAEFAARVFLKTNQRMSEDEALDTHAFVKNQLADLEERLLLAEGEWWEYLRRQQFRDYKRIPQEMAAMQDQINDIRGERELKDQQQAELEGQLARNQQNFSSSLSNVPDEVVEKLFSELDVLLGEKANLSVLYTPAYPPLQELEETISDKHKTIISTMDQAAGKALGGSDMWAQRKALLDALIELRMTLDGLELREFLLEKELQVRIREIPEFSNKKLEGDKLAETTESILEQRDFFAERERAIGIALLQGTGQLEWSEPVARATSIPFGAVGQFYHRRLGGLCDCFRPGLDARGQ